VLSLKLTRPADAERVLSLAGFWRAKKHDLTSRRSAHPARAREPQPKVSGIDELAGKSNYFIGDEFRPSGGAYIPTFGRVKYQEVYSGVNLVITVTSANWSMTSWSRRTRTPSRLNSASLAPSG